MTSRRTKEQANAVKILRQFETDVIQRVVGYTDWVHDLMDDHIEREYTPGDWYNDKKPLKFRAKIIRTQEITQEK